MLSRAPMRKVVARVRGEGERRQLGKGGDGRAGGGRESGREGERRRWRRGRTAAKRKEEKEGKEGKVQNARILAKRCRSEERGREGEAEGRGEMTQDSSLAHFSPPLISFPDIP